MSAALTAGRRWTADEFMVTDQAVFGDAWRYELVEGRILAHAAPAPDHGAIAAGLTAALAKRLAAMPGSCRPEVGTGAVPRSEQRNTARIPDVMVRCGEHPRVAFEVVSPSEIRNWRERDLKRRHLQAVDGVQEIVELYQDDFAAHIYRLMPDGAWTFESVDGEDAALRLESIGLDLPLAEIYAFVTLSRAPDDEGRAADAVGDR